MDKCLVLIKNGLWIRSHLVQRFPNDHVLARTGEVEVVGAGVS